MAKKEPKAWFTTKTGKHIPIYEGESKADAVKRIKASYSKSDSKKSTTESKDSKQSEKKSEKKKFDSEHRALSKTEKSKAYWKDNERRIKEGVKTKYGESHSKLSQHSEIQKMADEHVRKIWTQKGGVKLGELYDAADKFAEKNGMPKEKVRDAAFKAMAQKHVESVKLHDEGKDPLSAIGGSKQDNEIKKASDTAKSMNAEEKYRDSLKQGNKVTVKRGKTMFKGKEVQALDTKDALQEIRGDEKHAPKDNSLAKHLDKDGNLSEARKKIHAEILQDYFNGVIEAKKDQKPVAHQPYAPGEKRVAMFTGGGGASGKGAFSKDVGKYYSQNNNPMVIDPDALKSVLMKYDFPDKKSIDSELTGWYHEESSALAKQIYATALEHDFPVMYDGTATGSGIYKLLDMAKQKGYSPEMNFIFSDWKTVRQNSLDRLEKSGRFVPPEQQLGAHQKAYKAVEALQDKFDSFKLWDNAGRKMRLVGESSGNNKLKISNAESWNRFKTSADDFTLSKEEIDRFYDDADKISKKRKLAGL